MILEVAILNVREDKMEEFKLAFKRTEQYISSIGGYIRPSLKKCLEIKKNNIYYWSNGFQLKHANLDSAFHHNTKNGKLCSIIFIFMTRFRKYSIKEILNFNLKNR